MTSKEPRRDPVTVVGRFARVRVIIAVVIFLIALVAVLYRGLSG